MEVEVTETKPHTSGRPGPPLLAEGLPAEAAQFQGSPGPSGPVLTPSVTDAQPLVLYSYPAPAPLGPPSSDAQQAAPGPVLPLGSAPPSTAARGSSLLPLPVPSRLPTDSRPRVQSRGMNKPHGQRPAPSTLWGPSSLREREHDGCRLRASGPPVCLAVAGHGAQVPPGWVQAGWLCPLVGARLPP